jgi:uncharacterized Zn finger protein
MCTESITMKKGRPAMSCAERTPKDITCPRCGGGELESDYPPNVLYRAHDALIVACNTCGHMFRHEIEHDEMRKPDDSSV